MDLDYFFQRWIYGELYPIYEVFYDQPFNDLLVQINQLDETDNGKNIDLFEMPIDIKINFNDGSDLTTTVHNSIKEEMFTIPILEGKKVESIEFDPDDWILKKVTEVSRTDLTDPTKPTEFKLYPVFPNPFNSEISIKFYITKDDNVDINIYDISGKLVWTYTDSYFTGSNIVKWNGLSDSGNKIPSGSYIIEVKTDDLIKTQKVMHVK